ncbi:hypothetical protein P1P68_02195 [Streptomyces scabiei]|uniref:hypothetical protein n=1 Tax=Streptomyces scabiei TaxID=1930 RepID=UPI00298FD078|nr:hypothetical protein [Streptomyces scabiei]MDW8803645.1 hypothetical protein [Streptomyces scabiei]
MIDIKTRYHYGTPDADGRTPVFVDDATDPTGHVWRSARGAWWALVAGDEKQYATDHTRKYLAAERLVAVIDVRTSVAAETERRRARCTQTPAGWRFATWEEIEHEGYRQVRPVHRAPYISGDEGDRYPDGFANEPVTLNRITRLHNGHVVLSGTERGAHSPYVLLMDPAHADLGALIPERSARYVAPGDCPACEQDAQLYQAGTRLGCASCTAADLGISVDHLPAPIEDDGAVWWRVGDTARRTFDLPEGGEHAETGRVIETATHITERTRQVRVDYGGRWPISWDAAGLAPTA